MNLEDWRAEFPILDRKVYLNSCSLGALSHRAMNKVAQFHEDWNTWGASAWYELWLGRLSETRSAVARLLGASADEIALTASVSVALTAVGSAIDYGRRPRVVVADLDFPTLAYQWMVRPDVEVVRVRSDDGASIDPARYAEAIDDRTALIATSHVFFTTGAIQELSAIAKIAHDHGALFVVDAYQSAGQVPIDVRAADVDVLITGPLKWLLGGPGLAYLYVRNELIPQLMPRIAGWFGAREQFRFDIGVFEFRDDARRFELGTPALPTVHTALGGHEIIEEVGIGTIRQRNRHLTERMIRRARSAGMVVRCAETAESRSAIVMIAHDDPAGAVSALAARDIIVDWRPGFVRISPHFYNTDEEVDLVVDALANPAR